MDIVATQPETLIAPSTGKCAPAAGRNPLFDARAMQRAAIAPGQVRSDAALIDEDELRRIDLSGFPLPELALRFDSITVLLGGVE